MNMGLNCARVIAKLLKDNLDISHLVLNRNQLGDDGITIIAKYLEFNRTIIHIDIAQNELT